jgi:hypothetical protein
MFLVMKSSCNFGCIWLTLGGVLKRNVQPTQPSCQVFFCFFTHFKRASLAHWSPIEGEGYLYVWKNSNFSFFYPFSTFTPLLFPDAWLIVPILNFTQRNSYLSVTFVIVSGKAENFVIVANDQASRLCVKYQ